MFVNELHCIRTAAIASGHQRQKGQDQRETGALPRSKSYMCTHSGEEDGGNSKPTKPSGWSGANPEGVAGGKDTGGGRAERRKPPKCVPKPEPELEATEALATQERRIQPDGWTQRREASTGGVFLAPPESAGLDPDGGDGERVGSVRGPDLAAG